MQLSISSFKVLTPIYGEKQIIMICVPLCGALGVIGTIQSFLEYPHKVEVGGEETK